MTPVGRIEQLQVPRDREGEFVTAVFERYQRMTGNVEDAVLEMSARCKHEADRHYHQRLIERKDW